MFGFLFKRGNKNEASKQSRRSSKDLLNNSKDTDTTGQEPHGSGNLNFVSVSTDSLNPSISDSGKESKNASSTSGSLFNLLTDDTTTAKGVKIGIQEDNIDFIDEQKNLSETMNIMHNQEFNRKIEECLSCYQITKQLNEAEGKAMIQLEAIRSKLISKETELSLLQADINMLAVDRDNKTLEVQSLTSQLDVLKSENELSLKRIQTFEEELKELQRKNSHLSEELNKKSEQLKGVQDMEHIPKNTKEEESVAKIKEMNDKIRDLESERDQLVKDRDILEKEKVAKIKSLQDALEDTLEAKNKLKGKYEKELRDLQNSNGSLVDDFEWKLHQVEATCRQKLHEKDKQIAEKLREMKTSAAISNTAEREKLEDDRKSLQQQLREVEHLKAYEAEVTQLRGVTSEQQKSLKSASRQLEQFKLNERLIQNEVQSLKMLLEQEKTHSQIISNSVQRRIDASLREKVDEAKVKLNEEWETKLRKESSRLKDELEKVYMEEKFQAIESTKRETEKDFDTTKRNLEKSIQSLTQEISKLKEEMKVKEESFEKEITKSTTILDRDNCELRRQVDKMNEAHWEQMDALKQSHSEEIDLLTTRYNNVITQLEKVQKKVNEYEKTFRSTDSVETEKDSGIAADRSSQSLVDCTNNDDSEDDSECSTESEEEPESEEECDEEYEEETDDKVGTFRNPDDSINELREEVATLQDSIETLTLNLVTTTATAADDDVDLMSTAATIAGNVAIDNTTKLIDSVVNSVVGSDEHISSTSEQNTSSSENEYDVPTIFLIGVLLNLLYTFFHTILVTFWILFLLIAYYCKQRLGGKATRK